jgi:hypothetical protein
MSRVSVLVVLLVATAGIAFAQDNWQGPYGGSWSIDTNWSLGFAPGPSDDAVIDTGGNDWVILDTNPTINSLTLGDVDNGTGAFSFLVDGSAPQSLAIANALTVGQTGILELQAGSSVTVGADSTNAGQIQVLNGSLLSITGSLNNSAIIMTFPGRGNTFNISGDLTSSGQFILLADGDVATIGGDLNLSFGSIPPAFYLQGDSEVVTIGGNLNNDAAFDLTGNGDVANIGGDVNNGFQFYLGGVNDVATVSGNINNYSLNFLVYGTGNTVKVSGNLNNYGAILLGYQGGGGNTIDVSGDLSNTYLVDVELNSTLTVHGNVDNSAILSTNYFGSGGANTLNISGTFTNNATGVFSLLDSGDVGNVGVLVNNGSIFIAPGATLNLTNQPSGITDVVAGSTFDLAGTFNAGANNGFYQLTSVEGNLILENGQTTTSTPNGGTFTVSSTGYVEVKTGTTFNITGNVTVNSGGIFSVNDPLPTTVNITGMLTNLGGQVNVVGPSAFLNVGGIGNGGMLTLPEGSTVNVANGFYQLASGTLGEAIGANGFAIIAVNGGLVLLDGTLDVLLDPGYNPAIGSTFKFLMFSPGTLSGQFASIQNDIFNGGAEEWVLIYSNTGGYIELMAQANQPTPEPSSLLLLSSGLLVGVGLLRRKLTR